MARDRQDEIIELFESDALQAAKRLVSEEVIDEHRRQPSGPQSDQLTRLLMYLRGRPIEGKLTAVRLGVDRYGLCRLAEKRGVVPEMVGGEYAAADEVLHAVFVSRIEEMSEP